MVIRAIQQIRPGGAMTSKLTPQQKSPETLEEFPHFPPRDDMQNSIYLDRPAHQAALEAHFGNHDTIIVLSEIPVRWTPSQQEGHRIPDLLVAFNVDRTLAVDQNGYSIRDQGKPPDLVLEVASASTGGDDIGDKRRDYANFGIPEYWRFDPTGGVRHDAPIAGDILLDDGYHSIQVLEVGPQHLHGHSEVLNLDLCWHHGQLRWYDPAVQAHLMTFAEEREARIAEREARIVEREARIAEREARIAAEARVRELEAELERRRQG